MKKPAGIADALTVRSAPSASGAVSTPSREIRGRILHGTLARLFGRAVGGVLSLVALHFATRYFGPRAWGPVVTAVSLFTIFSAIGDFGAGRIVSREVARVEGDSATAYGTSLVAGSVLGAVAAVGLVAVAALLYFSRATTLLYVLALSPGVLFTAWWQTSASVLTGRERNDVRAVLDFASSALLLGGVFVVIGARLGGMGYVVASTVAVAVTAFVSLVLAARHVRPSWDFGRADVKRFARQSVPVGASLMLYALYLRVGVVLLTFFRGEKTVGVYGVAVQLALFVMSAPGFLMGAVLGPFMRADRQERHALSQHALALLVSVSLPIPVFLALFGHGFVLMLSGRAFTGAVHPLVVLGVACTIWYVNAGLLDLAVNEGGEHRVLRPLTVSALFSVAAALVAVPFFGMEGAAFVIVVTEVLNLVQYLRLYHSMTGFAPDLRGLVPAVAATVVLAGVAALVVHAGGVRVSDGPALVGQVCAAVAVYAAALVVTRRMAGGTGGRRRPRAPVEP